MSAIKVWLLTAAENRLVVCITPAASPHIQGQQSFKTESLLSVIVMTSSTTPCVHCQGGTHTTKGRGETNCQDDHIICCFFHEKKSHNFRMHRSTAMQLNSRHRTEFCVTVIFCFRKREGEKRVGEDL